MTQPYVKKSPEQVFLECLDEAIEQHPEQIKPLLPELLETARALTEGVEVDLDASLDDE